VSIRATKPWRGLFGGGFAELGVQWQEVSLTRESGAVDPPESSLVNSYPFSDRETIPAMGAHSWL